MGMFCYQCEQTARGTGCDVRGVCGKEPEVATLQDLLVYATKGISMYAHRARELGASNRKIDVFTIEALFTTVTNVDFDAERIRGFILKAAQIKDKARKLYEDSCAKSGKTPEQLDGPALWEPAADMDGLVKQGEAASILRRREHRRLRRPGSDWGPHRAG